MGGPVKKPYLELEGKPIFLRSIERFVGLEVAGPSPSKVAEIILVVGGAELDYVKAQWGDLISRYATPVRLVEGGKRRQDSVYCGLQSLNEDAEIVLIHDAVRPLVSTEIIKSVRTTAWEKGAVIPAVPIQATVKEVKIEEGKAVLEISGADLRKESAQIMLKRGKGTYKKLLQKLGAKNVLVSGNVMRIGNGFGVEYVIEWKV